MHTVYFIIIFIVYFPLSDTPDTFAHHEPCFHFRRISRREKKPDSLLTLLFSQTFSASVHLWRPKETQKPSGLPNTTSVECLSVELKLSCLSVSLMENHTVTLWRMPHSHYLRLREGNRRLLHWIQTVFYQSNKMRWSCLLFTKWLNLQDISCQLQLNVGCLFYSLFFYLTDLVRRDDITGYITELYFKGCFC